MDTMTDKHRDPEYLASARIVRAQVRRSWRLGIEVTCWRCGRVLEPGSPFDVGHRDPDARPTPANLSPECVRCNRSEGGRRGAAITNGRRPRPAPGARTSRVGLAPW